MTARPTGCSVEGCKRPYRAKGYCAVHFKKWRAGEMPKKTRYKICTEENCRKPMIRWGVCEAHLRARKGEPDQQGVPAAVPAAEAPAATAGEPAPA